MADVCADTRTLCMKVCVHWRQLIPHCTNPHPPVRTHRRGYRQPLRPSRLSGAVKICQIRSLRCDKYFCWPGGKKFMVRSVISANDDPLPSFPMMLGHFLAGGSFLEEMFLTMCSVVWDDRRGSEFFRGCTMYRCVLDSIKLMVDTRVRFCLC